MVDDYNDLSDDDEWKGRRFDVPLHRDVMIISRQLKMMLDASREFAIQNSWHRLPFEQHYA